MLTYCEAVGFLVEMKSASEIAKSSRTEYANRLRGATEAIAAVFETTTAAVQNDLETAMSLRDITLG